MTVHLIKLCVGIESVEHLQRFRKQRRLEQLAAGEAVESRHVTRMTPKRRDEVMDGGSLYWVIKGFIQVRQKIKRLDVVYDNDGIRRCAIVMSPRLYRTEWQARRPFQGWRYFDPEDVPADLPPGGKVTAAEQMPAEMRLELQKLGLL